ncbi:MAG: hypothetical protein AAB390_02440 [Patescibacteria group bacterium]
MFIIIDGIDGSGKSTIINNWTTYLRSQNKKIFILKDYWREFHTHPTFAEIEKYDVVISAEPTNVWTGLAIREELIKNGNDYPAETIAEAYALDRFMLYRRLIIPYLNLGKIVIQDRGVSTSLCYQPIQSQNLSMDDVAVIEGNALALKHAPDHLVIADVPAEIALARLDERTDKQDTAIFEKLDFLQKARTKFTDENYLSYFKKQGTKIHILDTNEKVDIMESIAVRLLEEMLS